MKSILTRGLFTIDGCDHKPIKRVGIVCLTCMFLSLVNIKIICLKLQPNNADTVLFNYCHIHFLYIAPRIILISANTNNIMISLPLCDKNLLVLSNLEACLVKASISGLPAWSKGTRQLIFFHRSISLISTKNIAISIPMQMKYKQPNIK